MAALALAGVLAWGSAACGDDEPVLEAPPTTAGTIPY